MKHQPIADLNRPQRVRAPVAKLSWTHARAPQDVLPQIETDFSLLADNVGWILINIVVPVILPPAGLLLARLTPLENAERERTRVLTTIQDSQLGCLALDWSAATVYEAWEYMATKGHVFTWVAILLAYEVVVVLTAMFMAVGGAVTTDTSPNRSSRLGGSIIVLTTSAFIFILTHLKTLPKEAAMSLLTKEQQSTIWTREQARTFISRICGISAAAAGLVAIATLLFVNH